MEYTHDLPQAPPIDTKCRPVLLVSDDPGDLNSTIALHGHACECEESADGHALKLIQPLGKASALVAHFALREFLRAVMVCNVVQWKLDA